jgi:hypothetical protein
MQNTILRSTTLENFLDVHFAAKSTGRSKSDILAEFHELRYIISESELSTEWSRAEAAWNLCVHGPLLKQALRTEKNVSHELMYASPILSLML